MKPEEVVPQVPPRLDRDVISRHQSPAQVRPLAAHFQPKLHPKPQSTVYEIVEKPNKTHLKQYNSGEKSRSKMGFNKIHQELTDLILREPPAGQTRPFMPLPRKVTVGPNVVDQNKGNTLQSVDPSLRLPAQSPGDITPPKSLRQNMERVTVSADKPRPVNRANRPKPVEQNRKETVAVRTGAGRPAYKLLRPAPPVPSELSSATSQHNRTVVDNNSDKVSPPIVHDKVPLMVVPRHHGPHVTNIQVKCSQPNTTKHAKSDETPTEPQSHKQWPPADRSGKMSPTNQTVGVVSATNANWTPSKVYKVTKVDKVTKVTKVTKVDKVTPNRIQQHIPQKKHHPSVRQTYCNLKDIAEQDAKLSVASGLDNVTDQTKYVELDENMYMHMSGNVNSPVFELDTEGYLLPKQTKDSEGYESVYEITCPVIKPTDTFEEIHTGKNADTFFSFGVRELNACLRKCGMAKFAAICKREYLDGAYMKCLSKQDFRQEPFRLTAFEVMKLGRIIEGWRPSL